MSRNPTEKSPSSTAAQLAADTVVKMGHDMTAAAVAKAEDVLQSTEDRLEQGVRDLWEDVQKSPMVADLNRYVRREPMKALVIVFGLGMLVGMSRRR